MPYPEVIAGDQPICYHPSYNLPLGWLTSKVGLHHFDTQKYAKIHAELAKHVVEFERYVQTPTEELADSLLPHSLAAEYRESLKTSEGVVKALELVPQQLKYVPHFLLKHTLLKSMKLQYAGSVLAAHRAMRLGYGFNIGGGYHHATRENGLGFCVFNDMTAIVETMFETRAVKKIMIIDFDAHMGDGHEYDCRDYIEQGRVHIVDAYEPHYYVDERGVRHLIDTKIYYEPEDDGTRFLKDMRRKLPKAIRDFQPDLVIYGAGTDPLAGDPYGDTKFSVDTIVERDEFVWKCCGFEPVQQARASAADAPAPKAKRARSKSPSARGRKSSRLAAKEKEEEEEVEEVGGGSSKGHKKNIPIVMLLCGGYTVKSTEAIYTSMKNIITKFGLLPTKS